MRFSDSDINGFIQEAKDDEVGLWLIIASVRRELNVSDHKNIRRITMDAILRLLESGEVTAGNYLPDRSGRVKAWNLENTAILKRVEEEWDRLGREPSFSEVVVFVGNDNPFLIES
jgi:hypothetical protein